MTSSDKSTPSPRESETFELQLSDFFNVLVRQTVRNWHKGGRDVWLQATIEKYIDEAEQNLAELRLALKYKNDVGDKAADVANDMFYIYDIWTNNHE